MDDYYAEQAGSGMGGFAGVRYQKGDGFFGRLVSGTILPIVKKVLPYLGKRALNTGFNILGDVAEGEKLKSSVKRRLRETGERVGADAMAKVRDITGSGKKRKRKRSAPKKAFVKKRKVVKTARKAARRNKKATDFL
jgi:hypothetical protein